MNKYEKNLEQSSLKPQCCTLYPPPPPSAPSTRVRKCLENAVDGLVLTYVS